MGMIDRYKKRGGFVQLVNLIETTGSEKRDKFLKMISEESPAWETAIKQKMLSIERMGTWEVPFLMEFLPQVPAKVIAFAISNQTEEKQKHFMSALSFGDRKKVEEFLKEPTKPQGGEIVSAQIKIINELRSMVAQGKVKLEKCDPEVAIPEDYEEILAGGGGAGTVRFGAPDPVVERAMSGATEPAASGQLGEELNMLRRKLVALTQENVRLNKENKDYKEKLDAVRSALSKAS
jgi:hypothetical protein